MSVFAINWDEIGQFQRLEKGWYEAVLETKGQPAEETKSGNPGQYVRFHIRVGDRTVPLRRKYAINSGFFKELVAATGYRTEGQDNFNTDSIHGKVVRVWVEPKVNENTGREFLDLGTVIPLNESPQAQANMPKPQTADPVLQRLMGNQANN